MILFKVHIVNESVVLLGWSKKTIENYQRGCASSTKRIDMAKIIRKISNEFVDSFWFMSLCRLFCNFIFVWTWGDWFYGAKVVTFLVFDFLVITLSCKIWLYNQMSISTSIICSSWIIVDIVVSRMYSIMLYYHFYYCWWSWLCVLIM